MSVIAMKIMEGLLSLVRENRVLARDTVDCQVEFPRGRNSLRAVRGVGRRDSEPYLEGSALKYRTSDVDGHAQKGDM